MKAIRRNFVIEICVLSRRSTKFVFSPENSLKPTNKQLLQQAKLIAGLRGLQTPLAHPVAVAASSHYAMIRGQERKGRLSGRRPGDVAFLAPPSPCTRRAAHSTPATPVREVSCG